MRNIKAFPITNVLPAASQICLRASKGARGRREGERCCCCCRQPAAVVLGVLSTDHAGAGIWVLRPHFAPWGSAKCDPRVWEAAPAPPRVLLSVLVLTARINPSGCVIRIGGGPFDPISTVLPRLNVSGLQIDSEFYKHPDGGAGKAERRKKLSPARSCWAAHEAARGWRRGQGERGPAAGSPPLAGTPPLGQPGGACSVPPARPGLRSLLRSGAQRQEQPRGSTRTR